MKQSVYLHKDYSQNGEQRIIEKYFLHKIGNLLDIGANDGITFSNSHALIKAGWAAVLVEPSPKAFQKLHNVYNGFDIVQCLELAIGMNNGSAVLKESGSLLNQGDIALVSSFLPEEQARWTSLNMPFEDVPVEVVDVKSLLKRTYIENFDFVSIDIEGMEKVVVPQFDFNAIGAKMVCIEFNSKDQTFFDRHMTHQGYKLIHKNAENLLYAK